MRNTNKKGFTIVELVIVVAVIAILAAVLIPTFAGIIRQANISSDTVVAKNLNTAVATYKTDVKTFEDAIAAAREAGYYLANLNAKADECYFVWDDEKDQFILVDGKDNYNVIYSNEVPSDKANWMFAISDAKLAKKVAADNYNVLKTLAKVEDLKDAIAAGGTIYMDESVVLDENNTILLDKGENLVLELGNATLTNQGSLSQPPVVVNKGSLTINGGNLGGAGKHTNENGTFNTTVQVGTNKTTERATLILDDTKIVNTLINPDDSEKNGSGIRVYRCNLSVSDVVIEAAKTCVYIANASDATLSNVTATSSTNAVLFVTHYAAVGVVMDKTTKMTIESGVYKNTAPATGDHKDSVVAVMNGAEVVINGGTFISENGSVFNFSNGGGTVTIYGGTFSDNPTAYLADGYVANQNADGMWVVSAEN